MEGHEPFAWSNPEWMKEAECRGSDPRLWHPKRGEDTTQAIAVCNTCPVKVECLEYALADNTLVGIYGGYSHRQRRKMRYGTSEAPE